MIQELDRFSREFGAQRMDSDYLKTVSELLQKDSVVLDAGCGHGGVFARSDLNTSERRKTVIGIDYGHDRNRYMDEQLVGDLAALPFPDGTFDIIVSEWVAEHIARPDEVFSEFNRVLKENGHVVLLMPNKNNPLVWFGGLVPSALKDLILRTLLRKDDRDLFPVYLRMNTPASIRRHAQESGFKEMLLRTYPNPEYFMFSNTILRLALWLEYRAIGWQWPKRFGMYILAAYTKPNGN